MRKRRPYFAFLVATMLSIGSTVRNAHGQEICGMWAGPLTVQPNPDPCDPYPPKYRLTGQGVFSGCCGGPGCWPTITIVNLTTLYQTYVEVGGCGGGNHRYSYLFVAAPPHFNIGDEVMFIRGNRTLSNAPTHCSGQLTVTVEDFPPSANPPHVQTQELTQFGIYEDMGGCPGGWVHSWGCTLLSYTMILNFHLGKHAIPGVTWQQVDEWLRNHDGYDPTGCARLKANADSLVAAYGVHLGIPGFGLAPCTATTTGVNDALCRFGPVMLKTKSQSDPGNDEKSHYVVAIGRSGSGDFEIRNSAGSPSSFGTTPYDGELRGCRTFKSSPAIEGGNILGTGAGSELTITVADNLGALVVGNALGKYTGIDAGGLVIEEIPSSHADIWGGLSAPDDPAVWHPDSLVVRLQEADGLYLAEQDASVQSALTAEAVLRTEDHLDRTSFTLGPEHTRRYALATVRADGMTRLVGAPVTSASGPFVVAMPALAPAAEAPRVSTAAGQRRMIHEGILWPRGLTSWSLDSLVFEAPVRAREHLHDLELWIDADGDDALTANDRLVAAGQLDADGLFVVTSNATRSEPVRFYLLANEESATSSMPAMLRQGALLSLALSGMALLALLLRGAVGARRRVAHPAAAPHRPQLALAVAMVVALLCGFAACHHSHGSTPPVQTVGVSLVFGSATDATSTQGVQVEGLPLPGPSVTF
ncbi:MAG: hypothetical protein KDC98_12800 [Planctomycetes bacterium]|nr:hypothetical protein [Planctomycetota bacterium]